MYIFCPSCHSTNIKKNGYTYYNKQNNQCKCCGRQFVLNNNHTKLQHKVGKDLTFYIEGFNTTIRARVSRLVRKSLSFSKKDKWHDLAIAWVFWQFRTAALHLMHRQNCKVLPRVNNKLDADYEVLSKIYDFEVNDKVRFIKVHAKNIGICPDWHPGEGGNAWLFIDEIMVE